VKVLSELSKVAYMDSSGGKCGVWWRRRGRLRRRNLIGVIFCVCWSTRHGIVVKTLELEIVRRVELNNTQS
jgi:hypothetical protein